MVSKRTPKGSKGKSQPTRGDEQETTLQATLAGLMKSVHHYTQLLNIEKTRIEEELEAQAGYYWNVCSLAASAKNLVDYYEDELKGVLYSTDAVRQKLREQDDKEPSEAKVEKYIRASKRYRRVQQQLRECKHVAEKTDRLVQAWNQRQFMLTKLADFEIARRYHEHDYSGGTKKARRSMNKDLEKRGKKRRDDG